MQRTLMLHFAGILTVLVTFAATPDCLSSTPRVRLSFEPPRVVLDLGLGQQAASDAARTAARLAADVRRADYQADLAALARLHDELASLPERPLMTARVRYWQGFALWRRAINAFNDAPDPAGIERDITAAVGDFEDAVRRDPSFVDAVAALASCLGYRSFLEKDDAVRTPLVLRALGLMVDSLAAAPDNPRVLWVLGPVEWRTAPNAAVELVDLRQSRTLRVYERGLDAAHREPVAGTLDPHWGEPELLMSLAWSHLNKRQPDPATALRFARQALMLVPDWHYVRDILIPQIEAARGAAARTPARGATMRRD
jgi:hypothetical protein